MAIHIEIEDWLITSDSLSFTLNQKKQYGEKSKTAGEYYYAPVGYYSTFESVIKAVLDKQLMESNAQSLEEILKEITDIKQKLKYFLTVE